MIILDELDTDDPHRPKLASVPPAHPVTRTQTPTPSLPDYEASQAQFKTPWTKRPHSRCWRITIYALIVYFLLTVGVGIPILVVKLRHRSSSVSNPYALWAGGPSSPPPGTITLGEAPLSLAMASQCNLWNAKDKPVGSLLRSDLQYVIPFNGSIFVRSNLTYNVDKAYLDKFNGSLYVDFNSDAEVSDAHVSVSMLYPSVEVRNSTYVCLMDTAGGNGLYIFAPQNLSRQDTLSFNITLLLPQNNSTPLQCSEFICDLPHFNQSFADLASHIAFDNVLLGGAMSSVVVESISAATIAVKSSLAEIRGNFSASQSLSLETVAEPINANIYLSNNGDYTQPTYLRLNTGNSELNANISVYLPSNAKKHHNRSQNFVAHAETFNAPLSIRLVHDPESIPAAILLHAESNLGDAVVSVDRHFSGTFDVATMFAAAEVLYSNNTSLDNDSGNSSSQLDMMMNNILDSGDGDDDSDDSGTPSPSSNSSRCLEYDLISDSRMSGWIGTPPRPTPSGRHGLNGQGHIGVVSSLNSAQLVLEP